MSGGSTLTIFWHCMGWSCIHPCWTWACDSHSPFQDWRRQSLPHIFLMRSSLAAFGCWRLVPSERLHYWHLAMTITLCEMTSVQWLPPLPRDKQNKQIKTLTLKTSTKKSFYMNQKCYPLLWAGWVTKLWFCTHICTHDSGCVWALQCDSAFINSIWF